MANVILAGGAFGMPWKSKIHRTVEPSAVKKAKARWIGTRNERGYGQRWAAASKAYLQRHPLCVRCMAMGVRMVSQVTDHIIPHRGDMELFWDESNWQALCIVCHNTKTAAEDGGFGNTT